MFTIVLKLIILLNHVSRRSPGSLIKRRWSTMFCFYFFSSQFSSLSVSLSRTLCVLSLAHFLGYKNFCILNYNKDSNRRSICSRRYRFNHADLSPSPIDFKLQTNNKTQNFCSHHQTPASQNIKNFIHFAVGFSFPPLNCFRMLNSWCASEEQ